MNKEELVGNMAARSGLIKKDAAKALDAFTKVTVEALTKGEKINLIGFGTFETRVRAQKMGRNPQTGKEIIIPATTVPVFKPGAPFKNAVK
jgi:DNA-binding protein HU-beta